MRYDTFFHFSSFIIFFLISFYPGTVCDGFNAQKSKYHGRHVDWKIVD